MLGIFKGIFGKKEDNKILPGGSGKVIFINRNNFFDALMEALPQKNAGSVLEWKETDQEPLLDEPLDLVVFAYPNTKTGLTEETAADFVRERIFSLLDWLEYFRRNPPAQFLFISSWKAGDPDSVMGAIYRNGEVLVEGYANGTGNKAKSLRRMHATAETLEQMKSWDKNTEKLLMNWLSENTPSGTYKMTLQEPKAVLAIERLADSETDYAVSKKIMTNMKEYFASDQVVEGLLYLKQLHTRKQE
ncbi:hypothetical protein J0B03_10280 [Alkalibacter rhizosphaerae]|uniref:Uncharacterized protein n=1 Tax=Alkalibacter rhizosphaerae TaxID=2815577 RepID=A0A974XE43_9FIRM|nr:hypothetical protein [Alkalibacter rhizosphaerae]QSX08174.1 hypothetical protein J0B03_10280 [Alkalibacter rhizosphaerae]